MITVSITGRPGLERVYHWRERARSLLVAEIPPQDVLWHEESMPALPFEDKQSLMRATPGAQPLRLKRDTWNLLQRVGCHRSVQRYAEMYEAIWRLAHGEHHLWELRHDALVQALHMKDAAIRREMHKTKAFVRFDLQQIDSGERVYVAWFEPEHDALELVVPFFEGRFAQLRWAILTPRLCVHWDGTEARYSGGIARPQVPDVDPCISAWQVYYRHIFNPARLRTQAMIREMPVRYWKNLPEAGLIPELVQNATNRTAAMLARRKTVDSEPAAVSYRLGTEQSSTDPHQCRLCPHANFATQAVLGEGPIDARLMLVGEQPGDREDLSGRPFVGPAGELLNRALTAAGLDRSSLYLTNAVKHFKWELRGKRRIHKTPGQREIMACRSFLLHELNSVRPDVIVALGASAAKALLTGSGLRSRSGEPLLLPSGITLLTTIHPSYILRQEDQAASRFAQLVNDLRIAGQALSQTPKIDRNYSGSPATVEPRLR